jgi:hypothetical protein
MDLTDYWRDFTDRLPLMIGRDVGQRVKSVSAGTPIRA